MITQGPATSATLDEADLLSVFHDVTARLERSQRQLRDEVSHLRQELSIANEQLERSRRLAAIGEMAAGIAHEVRNPLGSIGLYARMLAEDLASEPSLAAIAAKIQAEVRRLNAVVGDVLAFSREHRLHLTHQSPVELFDRALESAGVGLVHDLSVLRDDRQNDDLHLHVDADRIHQALVNIIRNAIEAMEAAPARSCVDRGSQHQRAALRTSVRCDDSGAWLCVEDAGPGIPEAARHRVFNPFFTTRATGTGLGLSIVHRIAEAHGGEVRLGTSQTLGGARIDMRVGCAARASDAHEECHDHRAPQLEAVLR